MSEETNTTTPPAPEPTEQDKPAISWEVIDIDKNALLFTNPKSKSALIKKALQDLPIYDGEKTKSSIFFPGKARRQLAELYRIQLELNIKVRTKVCLHNGVKGLLIWRVS